ncbi:MULTISPECIES: ribonuclease III [Sneathiella]|jgi:ribonuclease-3|uniref:ribonuclease III n=1 Tax=Sneathiella TaxID=510690 RepID=UPI00146D6C97|nr:ribonuclease III [Sneathiella aquimaris]
MPSNKKPLHQFMVKIGHNFNDESLLEEALTHSSLTKGGKRRKGQIRDYDRLEFLGDRVLGLVISEELFQRFKGAEAGELSRRYNAQVRKETLAEIAQQLDLQDYILMSEDLQAAGGCENPSILEDCVEALIAALYLDGGMKVARQFIEANWWCRLDNKSAKNKDPKSALQEWAAKQGKPIPVYTVINECGPDHARTFTIEVFVEGYPTYGASAMSKRGAEQLAAEKLLKEQRNG